MSKRNLYIKKILNCIVWGVSYVEVTVVTLCEQVPNGRTTTSNNTVCQPILWKKPIKDWDELLRYGKHPDRFFIKRQLFTFRESALPRQKENKLPFAHLT